MQLVDGLSGGRSRTEIDNRQPRIANGNAGFGLYPNPLRVGPSTVERTYHFPVLRLKRASRGSPFKVQ